MQDIDNAKDLLLTARRRLNEELATYPTPISGCDEQYNHLLRQKHKIEAALAALDESIHIPTPRNP